MNPPFLWKPTNPKSIPPQPPLLSCSYTQSQYFPCPKWTPWQTPDNWGQTYAPEPAGITQTILNCLLSLPFLYCRKHDRGCCLCFSFIPFCLLTNTGASPCGPEWHGMPFISGATFLSVTLTFQCFYSIIFVY